MARFPVGGGGLVSYIFHYVSKQKYNVDHTKVGVLGKKLYDLFCWKIFLKVLGEKYLRDFTFPPESRFGG